MNPIVSEQPLLSTDRFEVARVQYQLANGEAFVREVIRHPGSVVILPVLDEDHLCLIRNFRVAVDKTLIELPAGTLDVGEDPDICAARELTEETGYVAGRLERLTSFYAAPGILDEQMHLYAAFQLVEGPPAREKGEIIENQVVRWDEALRLIDNGTINDAKTIVGLLFYRQRMKT